MDNNTISMKESTKTDAQLVEELSATNRKMRQLLNESNSLLRSALSVAERKGESTFWDAFKGQLESALKKQHDFFNH